MFILGPNWVVYSSPHDATSFVIFFNFEFKMLYECECIRYFGINFGIFLMYVIVFLFEIAR